MTKINQKSNVSLYLFNSLMVVFIFLLVTILSSYQGVVDSQYHKVGFRNLLTLSFWKVALTQGDREPVFADCNVQTEFIYQDKDDYTIICDKEKCYFALDKLLPDKNSFLIEILTQGGDQDSSSLADTQLLWADASQGKILYIIPNSNQAFFVQYDEKNMSQNNKSISPHLWHDIDLSPSGNQQIHLLAIKRSVQNDDYLVAYNPVREELYLYALDGKWLRKIEVHSLDFKLEQISSADGCLETTQGEIVSLSNLK